jgi:exoribonuclease-2
VQKGTLVEFKVHNDRRLGIVERPEGKKLWIILDERSQSHTLHPRDITYEGSDHSYRVSDIPSFRQQVNAYLDPSALEVAWELCVEEGESTDPQGLAEVLFSSQTDICCYAAHCLLVEDRVFFKQRGDRYEPRTQLQVNELKHQMTVAAQRQQEWQEFLHQIQQVLTANSNQVESPHLDGAWVIPHRSRIDSLERLATFGNEAIHITYAQELLTALGRAGTSEGAFQLLVDLGLWSSHENLILRRSACPIQFSAKVIDVVNDRLQFPPIDLDVQRLDLTHLKVYTIDDASTTEIDDGLSWQTVVDRDGEWHHQIWVHIADPTRWLSPGDELDLEARRRATTLYLPTGMISMFPVELATGPMSLKEGKVCCSLSFAITLDETGSVADYSIHSSMIKPTYRLTYEDVDEILELDIQAEPELLGIAKQAKLRRQWRQSQGAINISMPESSIKVCGDEVKIDLLDDSPSRNLVAEMMILTGEVASLYGQLHSLPLPFRHQPQPELPSDEELLQLPAGPVRDCAIRRCMPRSEMSVTPMRHASLGLSTYTQVTSPIRRYTDLLAHFQIKAHLRGDPLPFTLAKMQELLLGLGTAVGEAVQVERQTNRYWGLEYLRRQPGEVWNALVLRWLREHEKLALVLLEDLGLELPAKFGRTLQLGDRVYLKVVHVDPRQDVIHFQEIHDLIV